MFADSYPMEEVVDGFFYQVQGKVCIDDHSKSRTGCPLCCL